MAPIATPLTKRLVSYSAAAGVTIALASSADAQVVYTDVDPDFVSTLNDTFSLDVDGDGTVDFEVSVNEGGGTATLARVLFVNANSGATNAVIGVDAPYFTNPDLGSATRFDANDTIDGNGSFFPIGILGSIYNGTPYYNFVGAEGFVGFRFTAGTGDTHYGWARVAVSEVTETASDFTGTTFEYAYESTPNTAIIAGDVGNPTATEPDALAEGYRFTPVAPNPALGNARFEVTVGRAEAVRVEIFDALGRSQAVLHDGAMAAGTATPFALDTASLAAGVYVVRVTGESFNTSRTVTVLR